MYSSGANYGWKPGTSVTVKATVYGKDLGGGLYGQSDVSTSFKIGQSKIAIADSNTKTMQVYIGGQLVKTMPVSMGMGEWASVRCDIERMSAHLSMCRASIGSSSLIWMPGTFVRMAP